MQQQQAKEELICGHGEPLERTHSNGDVLGSGEEPIQ